MPRCSIKLGFRHHSAVWFGRARDVKHRWTRFIGPRLNQVKLFDRLFVMSCDRHELERFHFSQQSVMHAGLVTSGRESPTNMFRFGILIALRLLASRVASAGSKPFRYRM